MKHLIALALCVTSLAIAAPAPATAAIIQVITQDGAVMYVDIGTGKQVAPREEGIMRSSGADNTIGFVDRPTEPECYPAPAAALNTYGQVYYFNNHVSVDCFDKTAEYSVRELFLIAEIFDQLDSFASIPGNAAEGILAFIRGNAAAWQEFQDMTKADLHGTRLDHAAYDGPYGVAGGSEEVAGWCYNPRPPYYTAWNGTEVVWGYDRSSTALRDVCKVLFE